MKYYVRSVWISLALLQVPAFAQTKLHVSTPGNLSKSAYKGAISRLPYSRNPQSVLAGPVQVAVKLSDPPLVVQVGANAKQTGIKMTAAQQQAYLAQLKQKQDAVMSQVRTMGGTEIGRVSKSHNALFVSIDARQLQ